MIGIKSIPITTSSAKPINIRISLKWCSKFTIDVGDPHANDGGIHKSWIQRGLNEVGDTEFESVTSAVWIGLNHIP